MDLHTFLDLFGVLPESLSRHSQNSFDEEVNYLQYFNMLAYTPNNQKFEFAGTRFAFALERTTSFLATYYFVTIRSLEGDKNAHFGIASFEFGTFDSMDFTCPGTILVRHSRPLTRY